MAISAARIRSISNRYRIAEEMAFPGLRETSRTTRSNRKRSVPRGEILRHALTRAGLA